MTKEERISDIERGRTITHSVENSLWKSLWTCRKTLWNECILSVLSHIVVGPKRDEVTGDCRKLYYELLYLYPSNIIRAIK
jgi:hypothetical protein